MGIPLVAMGTGYGQPQAPQQPNLLGNATTAMNLRGLMQGQQQQAQLFPGQLQEQQQGAQMRDIQIKQAQMQLQDAQGFNQALRDSYGGGGQGTASQPQGVPSQPQYAPAQPQSAPAQSQGAPAQVPIEQPAVKASSPVDRIQALLDKIQNPKYGISMQGQMGAIEKITSLRTAVEKMDSDQIANIDKAHGMIASGMNSVLESAPEDQAAQWTLERNQLMRDPTLAKFAQTIPAQYPGTPGPGGSPEAQRMLHSLMAEKDVIDSVKEGAELPGQKAKAAQEQRAAAAPTPEQVQNATATIATYGATPPNMRAGFANEIKNAPDWETVQKIQARADSANESFQRSADARQQAMAMKDVAVQQVVAGKMVSEDEKLGGTLDQTQRIRGMLNMSKGGNETATAAAQLAFAEHMIVEGGAKRLSPALMQDLTTGLGTYGRQFKAWADKGVVGGMPPATNAEMQSVLDAEEKSANQSHERNVGYIRRRYADVESGKAQQPSANAKQSDPLGIR